MPPPISRYHDPAPSLSGTIPAAFHNRSSIAFVPLRSPRETKGALAASIAVKAARSTHQKGHNHGSASDGAFEAPIENDFPAFGMPFRAVDQAQLFSLISIARERHKAFNWLCGYAPENRWDETPTDT